MCAPHTAHLPIGLIAPVSSIRRLDYKFLFVIAEIITRVVKTRLYYIFFFPKNASDQILKFTFSTFINIFQLESIKGLLLIKETIPSKGIIEKLRAAVCARRWVF